MNTERRLQIIAEARAIVAGNDMPLWPMAAALHSATRASSPCYTWLARSWSGTIYMPCRRTAPGQTALPRFASSYGKNG